MPIDIEKDDVQTALKKLKARESSFQLLESISKLGSWEVDLITHKSIWSKNSYLIYDIKPFSIQPNLNYFLSHLLPEDLPKAQHTIEKLMQIHQPQTFQGKIKTDAGNIKSLLLNAQVVCDADNKPIKLVGTTQDITK